MNLRKLASTLLLSWVFVCGQAKIEKRFADRNFTFIGSAKIKREGPRGSSLFGG